MGNPQSTSGLAGCTNGAPITAAQVASATHITLPTCTARPAELHQNCARTLGPEWTNDGEEVSGSGAKLKCRRQAYAGDKTTCCLGDRPATGTCAPGLGPTAGECRDTLRGYCVQGDRAFTDSRCLAWARANPNLSIPLKTEACRGKMATDGRCRGFAQEGSSQGQLDPLMIAHCQQHFDDPLCSCVNSEMECPNKFDRACVSKGGYKTADMVGTQCPDVMRCNQYVTLSPGAMALAMNVEQDCEMNTAGTTKTTNDTMTIVIIIVMLFILVIIIALIVKLATRHDAKTNSDTDLTRLDSVGRQLLP